MRFFQKRAEEYFDALKKEKKLHAELQWEIEVRMYTSIHTCNIATLFKFNYFMHTVIKISANKDGEHLYVHFSAFIQKVYTQNADLQALDRKNRDRIQVTSVLKKQHCVCVHTLM